MHPTECLIHWLLAPRRLGIADPFGPWPAAGEFRWRGERARSRACHPCTRVHAVLPPYVTNRPVAWLKFAAQARRPIHRITEVLAWLGSRPQLSPSGTLRFEAHRIVEWRLSGLPAPRLLAVGEDYLVTADAGPTLICWLAAEASVACRLNLLERAAQALGRVHGAGFCHGDPLLRHIAYDGMHVTFLHLEEPPPVRMASSFAQARDMLRFLVSAAGALPGDRLATYVRALWTAYLRGKPSSRTVQTLRRTLPLLRWLSRLSILLPSALLGRDAARSFYVFRHTS